MKLDLTDADLKTLEQMKRVDPVIKYFENRSRVKFNIGDILIKKTKSPWNDQSPWHVETIHGRSGLPRRYVYCHEDENGVGYLKRLKVTDGKLGQELIATTQIDFENTIFEVDPLYLESIMLGDGSFNIKALQKIENQRKKDIEEFNIKLCETKQKLSEINEWLKTRPIGGTFFVDYSHKDEHLGMNLRTFEVATIRELTAEAWGRSWKFNKNNANHDVDNVILVADSDGYEYDSFEFLDRKLYSTKPMGLFDGMK